MKYLFLILVLLLCACCGGKFKLSNGTIVTCSYASVDHCGMYLGGCSDGNEYQCQNNVIKIK